MGSTTAEFKQTTTGLAQLPERLIRETWPSVARRPPVAGLGQLLIRSYIGAPLGWLVMLPFYFEKILPFIATRYTLTNKRIMIRKGLKPVPSREVALSDIDEVRIVEDLNSSFFRAADILIVSRGEVALKLDGVPDPESFRQAIINASAVSAPGKSKTFLPFAPAKEGA